MIDLEFKGDWTSLGRLMKEIEKRYLSFLRAVAAESAKMGIEELKQRAPTSKDVGTAYKSGMKRVEVKVRRGEIDQDLWSGVRDTKTVKEKFGTADMRAVAIVYEAKAEAVRKKDADTTLIYVRKKKGGRMVHPGIYILMKQNPWTTDTLPWAPKSSDSQLLYRRASKNIVEITRKQRMRALPRVRIKLRRAGIAVGDEQMKGVKSARTFSDVAMQALRYEFGIGVRSKPHWRPAIRLVKKEGPLAFMKVKSLFRTMTDPSYRGWKLLGKLQKKINVQDVEDFNEFQKKISL